MTEDASRIMLIRTRWKGVRAVLVRRKTNMISSCNPRPVTVIEQKCPDVVANAARCVCVYATLRLLSSRKYLLV